MEVVSTGYKELDNIIGLGGLPKGRIIEIYGPTDVGKTTLAAKISNEVYKHVGTTLYIDTDCKFNREYMNSIGDISNMIILQPKDIEEAFDVINNVLDKELVSCIIIDSAPMLMSKEDKLKGFKESGDTSTAMFSSLLIKHTAKIRSNNILFIVINQLRFDGKKYYTPHLKVLSAISSIRIKLEKTDDDRVKATTMTNKLAEPMQSVIFDI
jgi:recombination protein RecA